MTRLRLRYSIHQQGLEDLYEIYDDTGETYGEPRPFLTARADMIYRQSCLDAQSQPEQSFTGTIYC